MSDNFFMGKTTFTTLTNDLCYFDRIDRGFIGKSIKEKCYIVARDTINDAERMIFSL